jgi:predicted ABC-class ATPase
VRLVVDRHKASLPDDLVSNAARRIGVEDILARKTVEAIAHQLGRARRTGPGTGNVSVESFGPAVVERSACRIGPERIELRLFVDLPAAGRRIRGLQAEKVFYTTLVRLATTVLLFSRNKIEEARLAADMVEDHRALQAELGGRGLVAFVAEGSLLARAGGDDAGPRRDGREVALDPPPSLTVELELPHRGRVKGMGIPAGVTLVVGGAFHGKSTLLDAVAAGVYPHHPGDGREVVATIPEAVVIRAEDGRSVRRADISGFLGQLPSGVLASEFTTDKASGSTSQASSIVEALEVGARLLLLDEDRCATNFMVRDGRMQRLVPRPAEPIVPFLDRVRELYERFGVSTILVTGGSGDYLEVADQVIQMNAYRPNDITGRARQVAATTRTMRLHEPVPSWEEPAAREPLLSAKIAADKLRTASRGPRAVRVGQETVDLRALEQLAETGQVRSLGRLMRRAAMRMRPGKSLFELIRELETWLDEAGLDALDPPAAYDLSRPRPFELAAALNRWRALTFRRHSRAGS